MSKNIIIILTALFLLPLLSNAQDDDAGLNVFFDTLEVYGSIEPTPVAVDAMEYIGNKYISRDDSLLMDYITRVVQFDVDFYADFSLITADPYFIKLYEITKLDLLAWQRLGADRVVKLEAEFPSSGNIRVRWRILDANRAQKINNGVISRSKAEWRIIGHEVSNEVVRSLTGGDGIFLTKIVYAKKIGEAKEIYMSDYDGANEVQLTNTKTINISPVFHPTKPEVYFTSYWEGDPKLYKVDINTREMSRVANYKGIVAAPAISPDGNKIACVLSKDGNSEIYVLDINGRIIKRLTNHRAIDSAPTWSPDGRMIAFSSDRTGSPQIYIMDSDGLQLKRLTYQSSYNDSPIWSSRGDRITFVSRTKYGRFDLASIDTSGLDYRILTEVGMNENPHFSPDGKHIIFSSTRRGPMDIYTMDITGRNQRRLTRYGDCSNPNWGPLR